MSGSAKKMRPGRVVQVRLNAKDCMAVVDIIQQCHMFVQGMSFSHAASIAFACMAETFRKNEVIPTRVGFEYSDMMASFPPSIKGRGAFQFKLHKTLTPQFSEEYTYPTGGLEVEQESETFKEPNPETHPNMEVRRLFRELKELDARKVVDPLNFDQALYDRLNAELCKLI